MKQKYYRLTNILKEKAQYNILLGERSNGKSYAVKEKCLMDAWADNNKKFILLRRWELEIKPTQTELYFKDAPISTITGGEANGVWCYRGKLYFVNYGEDGKKVNVKHIGYTMSLNSEQHYTSGVYEDVSNVIFEEFISRDYYLPNEPNHLMNLISTVARRRAITVYMIGNTISRLCPYFREWQLINVPKQKQGTIDVYNQKTAEQDENGKNIIVKIAVEFCENSGRNSKMFFGTNAGMVTTGTWQTEEQPHLNGKLKTDYNEIYSIVLQVDAFMFLCRLVVSKTDNTMLWYIEPKTTPIHSGTRLITNNRFEIGNMITYDLTGLSMLESQCLSLLKTGAVCFSDNLTGSDFKNCLKYVI